MTNDAAAIAAAQRRALLALLSLPAFIARVPLNRVRSAIGACKPGPRRHECRACYAPIPPGRRGRLCRACRGEP